VLKLEIGDRNFQIKNGYEQGDSLQKILRSTTKSSSNLRGQIHRHINGLTG
jgi:hypothetical protein